MLRKLTKHEFKATSRYILPLYLILLALTLLNKIMLSLDIFKGVLKYVSYMMLIVYSFSLVAVAIVTLVIMIARFYKNLVTDEGYLTFTLPVKTNQIINSKMIIAILWTLASVLLIFASIIVVSSTSLGDLQDAFRLGYASLKDTFPNRTLIIVIQLIVLLILTIIHNILLIYVSIAIGQLINGHRLIGSFLAYVVITTLSQILMAILIVVVVYIFGGSLNDTSIIPHIIFPISIVITLILNFLFYYGTSYIFSQKLNLE